MRNFEIVEPNDPVDKHKDKKNYGKNPLKYTTDSTDSPFLCPSPFSAPVFKSRFSVAEYLQ